MSGEKKGFWSLFRTRTPEDSRPRHHSGSSHNVVRRRRSDAPHRHSSPPPPPSPSPSPPLRSPGPADIESARRRPRRSKAKGKGQELPPDGNGGDGPYEHGPLTEWPPSGVSSEEELSLGHARELVSRGVPMHKGHKRAVQHASDHYYALFVTTSGNGSSRGKDDGVGAKSGGKAAGAAAAPSAPAAAAETDGANLHDSMTQLMTLRYLGNGPSGPASRPWETLEQPSYAFYFGQRAGTVTLNRWVSMASVLPPTIALRDPGVMPREVNLRTVLARLKHLERGLEDDNEDQMYKNLYRTLLKDPDKILSPHKTLDRQITDLILVLSRPDWIDFTNPRNQIVTKFIFDTSSASSSSHPEKKADYLKFFHQLLLASELDMRINSRQHMETPRERVLSQLPPTIQWSLALSRRWRDNVRIEEYGDVADDVRLRLKLKKRQMKMLKRFAQMMKWPNLAATLESLAQTDDDGALGAVSSHAMAFFSGLVLPGPTFPFLIMNALIDIDPDPATDSLALLSHHHPSCGFQYRSSYTYWSSSSVVGKVLSPTCREVAGWVGPARPTSDLGRSQIARIRTRRPVVRKTTTVTAGGGGEGSSGRTSAPGMTPEDVLSMAERSDPLGPPSEVFPVREYTLPFPRTDSAGVEDVVDTVRIELLTLRRVDGGGRGLSSPSAAEVGTKTGSGSGSGRRRSEGSSAAASARGDRGGPPGLFDASLQFAIDGTSWPLRLSYDVEFVCAWPCSGGPHPLFFDYSHSIVMADRLVEVRDWAGMYGGGGGGGGSSSISGGSGLSSSSLGGGGRPGSTAAAARRGPLSSSSSAAARMKQAAGVAAAAAPPGVTRDPDDDEKVLVVEAFGVPDNEVLARAWCAHWGLNAVVADMKRTCMPCAIREAYAATITVVILVEGTNDDRD